MYIAIGIAIYSYSIDDTCIMDNSLNIGPGLTEFKKVDKSKCTHTAIVTIYRSYRRKSFEAESFRRFQR